ncbi:MAG: DUF2656 domain-containing protein [Cyanobacteria bacterium J06649_4]
MTDNAEGRMLLSHNFTLPEAEVHPLNREEFAEVFIKGLSDAAGIDCALIDNPHWVVAVTYDADKYSPTQVGEQCAQTLASYRKAHSPEKGQKTFTVMALGGVKNTPATSPSPSLQTGEWGVDVVETVDPQEFLDEINWDKLAGAKPAEEIFRIDCPV